MRGGQGANGFRRVDIQALLSYPRTFPGRPYGVPAHGTKAPATTRAYCMAHTEVFRRLLLSSLAAGTMAFVGAGCAGSGESGQPEEPEPNLRVLSRLAAAIADSVVAGEGPWQRVQLSVEPPAFWFVFDAFERAVRVQGGTVVAAGESSAARLEVNVVEAATRYADPRRSWVFGPVDIARSIRVHLRVRAQRADSLRTVSTGSALREWRDTVAAAGVAALETDGVPATRATLPEGDWFDDFAEPIIVAAAIVVAVVLLFTVRS
jgi:hypothetical protein